MKRLLTTATIWILAFIVTYVAMVLANSLGAQIHQDSPSYGSSRMYQEISGLARFLVHVIPALCVGFFARRFGWQFSGAFSFIVELSGNLDLFGRDGLPFIGDPLATTITYVALAVLTAFWMTTVRQSRSVATAPK